MRKLFVPLLYLMSEIIACGAQCPSSNSSVIAIMFLASHMAHQDRLFHNTEADSFLHAMMMQGMWV